MRRAVLVLTGLGLLAGPAAADTFDRTVKANTRAAIGGFLGYEVDTCYPSVVPDAKVRQAPANGTIQFVPHQQKLGNDTRCPGTTVRGLVYVYTPNKGFKGTDELAIDLPWASTDSGPQLIRTHTFRIRVE